MAKRIIPYVKWHKNPDYKPEDGDDDEDDDEDDDGDDDS